MVAHSAAGRLLCAYFSALVTCANIQLADIGYDRHERSCVDGYNIRLISDQSTAECAALCDADVACVGFEYIVDYGGNDTSFNPRDCQLSSGVDMTGCDGDHYNCDFYTPSAGADTGSGSGAGGDNSSGSGSWAADLEEESQSGIYYIELDSSSESGSWGDLEEELEEEPPPNACSSAVDLLNITSPYNGTNAGVPNTEHISNYTPCGRNGSTAVLFTIVLEPGGTINIGLLGYDRHERSCIYSPSSNIMMIPSQTIPECEALCDAHASCAGFECGATHGGSDSSRQPGDCHLQSSANMAGCDGGDHNLDFYTPRSDSNSYDSIHETRWGGACPGEKSVTCIDATAPDTARHIWTNGEASPQTVYFAVDVDTSGFGSFFLYWSIVYPPPLAPPSCSVAVDLLAVTSPHSGDTHGAANDYSSCGNGNEAIFAAFIQPGEAIDSRHGLERL